MGATLTYGLIIIGVLLSVFLGGMFIFRPLIQTYLHKGQAWYITALVAVAVFSFFLSKVFVYPFCMGVSFYWGCSTLVHFIVMVSCCMLFWKVTSRKERTL